MQRVRDGRSDHRQDTCTSQKVTRCCCADAICLYRVESILLCADIYNCTMHKQLQVLAIW